MAQSVDEYIDAALAENGIPILDSDNIRSSLEWERLLLLIVPVAGLVILVVVTLSISLNVNTGTGFTGSPIAWGFMAVAAIALGTLITWIFGIAKLHRLQHCYEGLDAYVSTRSPKAVPPVALALQRSLATNPHLATHLGVAYVAAKSGGRNYGTVSALYADILSAGLTTHRRRYLMQWDSRNPHKTA